MFDDSKTHRTADHDAATPAVAPPIGAVNAVPPIGAVNTALGAQGGMSHGNARIHDDATSHAAADALGARAFTAGTSVFFGAGQYAPGTPQGDELLRHEMTHVDQARGSAAPQPGNFRVSDPANAEEHAADAGASGETAQPHTIYRKAHGGHAPAAHGAGPAAHGRGHAREAHAAPGGPVAHASDDPYPTWKQAIEAGDRAGATSQWASLSAAARARAGREPVAFLRKVVEVMQKDSPQVLRSAHADIEHLVTAIFSSPEFSLFMPELREEHLLMPFLRAAPHRGHVTQTRAAKLQLWGEQAKNAHEARALFNKVYPALHDHATTDDESHAIPWTLPHITRLYNILTHYLPVGHVQTITGGFVLQKGHDFGWYDGELNRIFLPGHGGSRSGKLDRKNHPNYDMTGGKRAGTTADYDRKDGTAGVQTLLGHYTVTALHEIGHGVGDAMGGNKYARDESSFPRWTPLEAERWADDLWTRPTGEGDSHVPSAARLNEHQARAMFLMEIQSGTESYKLDTASRVDIVKWVKSRYKNVPLFKWWKFIVLEGNGNYDSYRFDDDSARLRGSWAYSYLPRNYDGPFLRLKAKAYETRVSWYSMSSPVEWFAEQYAHYYRTEKTGGGLIDPDTMKWLDDHDKKSPKTGKKGKHGSDKPYAHGETGGDADDSHGGHASPGSPHGAHAEPLFFPW
jgi:Domain of unknown function (DUF4157)